MFLFGRKKKKEAERKRQEELARQQKIAEENKIKEEELKKQEEEKKKLEQEKAKAPKKVEKPKVESKPKPAPKKAVTKKTDVKKGPSGKYEIYEEAGLFKYRLKASNGEILVVSFGYATKKGAKSGIETFKKAVAGDNFEIITDKAEFSHFDLFGARGARVIVKGEFYKTLKLAESAVESVKKFYETERVLELEKIPVKEIREELVKDIKVTTNPNGKFVLVKEGKYYVIKLQASNAQVLLVSQNYASKQSALNGLEVIKKAIHARNFTVSRDKQDRYQYNLYSMNKQLIVSGESYPVKSNCISAISSVVRFAEDAKLVED